MLPAFVDNRPGLRPSGALIFNEIIQFIYWAKKNNKVKEINVSLRFNHESKRPNDVSLRLNLGSQKSYDGSLRSNHGTLRLNHESLRHNHGS